MMADVDQFVYESLFLKDTLPSIKSIEYQPLIIEQVLMI